MIAKMFLGLKLYKNMIKYNSKTNTKKLKVLEQLVQDIIALEHEKETQIDLNNNLNKIFEILKRQFIIDGFEDLWDDVYKDQIIK